jgi:DNA-directed RNA polymerase specialized sigma24 family protein
MEPPTSSAVALRREGAIPVLPTPNAAAMEDKPTLRQFFYAEKSSLLRFAHGLTGHRETAEDIVQGAFLKLHTHWHEVNASRPWSCRFVCCWEDLR